MAKVLFSAYLGPDGYGDLAHLADILKCYKDKDAVIVIAYFKDKEEPVMTSLKNHGLYRASNLFLIQLVREDLKNDETPRCISDNHDVLLQSKEYREALKSIEIILNISNPHFLLNIFPDKRYKEIFQGRKVRRINITEHGCEIDEGRHFVFFDEQYKMGIGKKQIGIFLKKPESKTKKEIILSIQSNQFLDALIGEAKDSSEKEHKAGLFLQSNIFFPGYYKYQQSFYLWLLALANAPLCKELNKDVITVFANIYYADPDIFNFESEQGKRLLKHLYDADVRTLEVIKTVQAEGKEEKTLVKKSYQIDRLAVSKKVVSKCPDPVGMRAKTIRVLNFRLPPHDFQRAMSLADGFAVGSGDKSVEDIFSKQLVLCPEVRSYKTFFLEQLREFFAGTLVEPGLALAIKEELWEDVWDDNGVGTPKIQTLSIDKLASIAKELSSGMTIEALPAVQAKIDELYRTKNLFDVLPPIIAKQIRMASASQVSCLPVSKFKLAQGAAAPEEKGLTQAPSVVYFV